MVYLICLEDKPENKPENKTGNIMDAAPGYSSAYDDLTGSRQVLISV